ncbi:hypothetical protein B0H16DRAFT_1729024 [Mycena metata]|uniref:Uncharacterized protein n=1 Tax=Mycena metata TaxID=1033252 RepID=A0AAD7ID07_9AGAR|nr:hypothetical protein B0H16DRAFT_1729024 [Mycena metata]
MKRKTNQKETPPDPAPDVHQPRRTRAETAAAAQTQKPKGNRRAIPPAPAAPRRPGLRGSKHTAATADGSASQNEQPTPKVDARSENDQAASNPASRAVSPELDVPPEFEIVEDDQYDSDLFDYPPDPRFPSDDSGSDDDFEKTHGLDKRRSATLNDGENEPDEDDAQPKPKPKPRGGKRRARGNSKGKSKADATASDDDNNDADADDEAPPKSRRSGNKGKGKQKEDTAPPASDAEDGSESSRRAGPLPAQAKEQAEALRATFHKGLDDLARKYGKDVQVFHKLLGTALKPTRDTSPWNHFQGNPPTCLAQEWSGYVSQLWKDKLVEGGLDPESKPDSPTIFAALPWLKIWVEKNRAALVEYRIESGAFPGDIHRFTTSLNKTCTQAHEQFGLHVFGQVIDVQGGNSIFFGGSEAVTRLRQQNQAHSKKTLKEYECKIGVIEAAIQREAGVATDDLPPSIYVSDTWDRDKGRAYVKQCLIEDQVKIEVARGTFLPDSAEASNYAMHWNFADHGYQHQMRICHWPDSMASNEYYPKASFSQTEHSGNVKYADDPAAAPGKTVQVVEWTEDEKNLALKDQGEIPLVVTQKGTVVLKVKDSKKFIKAAGLTDDMPKPKKLKAKANPETMASSDDDEDADPISPPSPIVEKKPKKKEKQPILPLRPAPRAPALRAPAPHAPHAPAQPGPPAPPPAGSSSISLNSQIRTRPPLATTTHRRSAATTHISFIPRPRLRPATICTKHMAPPPMLRFLPPLPLLPPLILAVTIGRSMSPWRLRRRARCRSAPQVKQEEQEEQDDNPKKRKRPDDLDRDENGNFTKDAMKRLNDVATPHKDDPHKEFEGSIEDCEIQTQADHKTWCWQPATHVWLRLTPTQHFVADDFFKDDYLKWCKKYKLFTIRYLFIMPARNLIEWVNSNRRYDINLVRLSQPRKRHYRTLQELEREKRWHPQDPCEDCHLPVALFGFGSYVINDDDPTSGFYVFHKVCKACYPYNVLNARFDAIRDTTVGPPCTCPPGSIACGDVLTGCKLHVVPAMTLVPSGASHGWSPLLRLEQNQLLNNLTDKAFYDLEHASGRERDAVRERLCTLLYHKAQWLSDVNWTMPAKRELLFVMPPSAEESSAASDDSEKASISSSSTSTTLAADELPAALQLSCKGPIRRPAKIPANHPYDYSKKHQKHRQL